MRIARALLLPVAITAALAAPGCQDSQDTRPEQVAPALDDVDPAVRGLLDDWVVAFESREIDAVRLILADDERFVWLEDGQLRYPNAEAVVTALQSFPPELALSYRLAGVQVLPISDRSAWAYMSTETEIRSNDVVVSEFAGVVSMLVEQHDGRWRIAAAHTSNVTRPSSAR